MARKPTNKTDAPVKLYATIYRDTDSKWSHYECPGTLVSTDQAELLQELQDNMDFEDVSEYMIVELVPVVSVKPPAGPIITPATSFE